MNKEGEIRLLSIHVQSDLLKITEDDDKKPSKGWEQRTRDLINRQEEYFKEEHNELERAESRLNKRFDRNKEKADLIEQAHSLLEEGYQGKEWASRFLEIVQRSRP